MLRPVCFLVCTASFFLLLGAVQPDGIVSPSSVSASSIRLAQSGKVETARRDLRWLIRGERVMCVCPPASVAEPLDPPTTSAFAGMPAFSAGEHFKENITPSADVRIAWLGARFVRRFAIKIENAAGETALQFYTLLQPSRDRRIIDELDNRHETRLADLWCLLKRQAHGEPGVLLVDAVPTIFYVRDVFGELGAVDVVWGGAGWEIGASPAEGERMWPAGVRVMSR